MFSEWRKGKLKAHILHLHNYKVRLEFGFIVNLNWYSWVSILALAFLLISMRLQRNEDEDTIGGKQSFTITSCFDGNINYTMD